MKKKIVTLETLKGCDRRLVLECATVTKGSADFLVRDSTGKIRPMRWREPNPDLHPADIKVARRIVDALPNIREDRRTEAEQQALFALYVELAKFIVLSLLTLAVISLVIHFIWYA